MPITYPIGGGKGGSGKSFITASLGVSLAKEGKRVLLIDLDLGGSNLHSFLGLKNTEIGLNEYLNKRFQDLEQVILSTSIPNLFIISSANCSMESANLFYLQKLKIIRAIQRLAFDYILLDLGAGTSFNTLDFFLTSNEGIFVVTPEPTSIENAFRFIKSVYFRRIKQVLKHNEFQRIMKEVLDGSRIGIIRWPSDIIDTLVEQEPERGELLENKLGEYGFNIILNQFRRNSDSSLGNKIERVCNKHFYSKFEFLGNVNYDERVHDSILSKNIYINTYPYTVTATDLQNVVNKISENGQTPVSTHQDRYEEI
jgi:flagellar biosynthesis protein FlhG